MVEGRPSRASKTQALAFIKGDNDCDNEHDDECDINDADMAIDDDDDEEIQDQAAGSDDNLVKSSKRVNAKAISSSTCAYKKSESKQVKKEKNRNCTSKVNKNKFDRSINSNSRTTRVTGAALHYAEGSSDDEYALQHFILPDDEVRNHSNKNVKCADDGNDSDDDDDDDNEMVYRIQYILGIKTLTAASWRKVCDKMTTSEINRGSILNQPDNEYYDESNTFVDKYLIKWTHASFLHVSWETEKDLLDLVGPSSKAMLKRFRTRKQEIFEDLRSGEYFPPSFLHIDRVINVEDESIDIQTIDWMNAKSYWDDQNSTNAISPASDTNSNLDEIIDAALMESDNENVVGDCTTAAASDIGSNDEDDVEGEVEVMAHRSSDIDIVEGEANEEAIDDDDDEVPLFRSRRSKRIVDDADCKNTVSKKKVTKAAAGVSLHGSDCYLSVKWEGLTYSDVTIESVADLHRCGIEYESLLRAFYRREQSPVAKMGTKKIKRTLDIDLMESTEAPVFPCGTLRDYQWEGVRWLLYNWSQRRNSILADEMGLGKTIQSAAFLQMLKTSQRLRGPFLIVVPLSTLVNWQREISAWTDLDVIVYHGSTEDRDIIREYEFKYCSKKKIGYKLEIVVTTPETCMSPDSNSSMRKELSKICWDMIIVDEAHKLKNYDSKLSVTLRDEYDYRNCLLLTGTPLQNNTDELWTLLNFVDRDTFADRSSFVDDFGDLKTKQQLDMLQEKLKAYLLRREKEHVEKTVPPKEEIIIEVELTIPQKQYYRAIYEQKTGFLYKSERGAKDGPSLSNLAMELRKCCNHPFLVKGAEKELAKHFVDETTLDIMVKSSGKMTLLDKLLPKLQADGHRVLIFSQFRIMLDIIEDYMVGKGFQFERVDGAVTGKKRQAAIDRYAEPDKGVFAMLLSTRAGGVGINLTAADTVIIYDSDWNPQNDIQAQARAHRIGQTRPVKVYRLLTRKTYETAMFRAASLKLGLDYAVMHNMRGSSIGMDGITSDRSEHVSSLSKKELENLLKHGAYDVFHDADDENISFCESDIDHILQRSTVVVHDGNTSKVSTSNASSGFSKASFVSATSDNTANNISIDDPDFWSKVVGLSVATDADEGSRKRRCRNETVSYKEPSMSAFLINSRGDESDSGGDDAKHDKSGKRCKKDKDDDSDVVADWSDDSMNRLSIAMMYRGYGNWKAIRSESKLRWSIADVSRAGQYLVLQLLLQLSLTMNATSAYIDYNLLDINISKSKTCRLALAGYKESPYVIDPYNVPSSAAATGNTDIPTDVPLLSNAWRDAVEKDATVIHFIDAVVKDNQLHALSPACYLTLHTTTAATTTVDSESDSMDVVDTSPLAPSTSVSHAAIEIMHAIHLPVQSLVAIADSSDKLSKLKLIARNKLTQLDDCFEFYLAAAGPIGRGAIWGSDQILVNDTATAPTSTADVMDAAVSDNVVAVSQPVRLAPPVALLDFLCAQQQDGDNEDIDEDADDDDDTAINATTKPPSESEWNHGADIIFTEAVATIGWPEGKRKVAALLDFFHSRLGIEVDDVIKKYPLLRDQKLIAKKARALAILYRGEQKKVAVSSAASDAVKVKKLISAVVKTMQRIGRPRSMYNDLATHTMYLNTSEATVSSAPSIVSSTADVVSINDSIRSMLLTWETFSKECGTDDVCKVRSIVDAIVDASDSIPGSVDSVKDGDKSVVTDGILSGIAWKQIELCCEKADVMHNLRLALATSDQTRLNAYIQRNCKGTGPSTHPSKRDLTMPVWWTRAHDYLLLKLTATHGLGKWKFISIDNQLCTALADFEMPPRSNGIEWVTNLSIKSAEKRFNSLLQVITASITPATLPPSSPDYVSRNAKASGKKGSSNAAMSAKPSWAKIGFAPTSSSAATPASTSWTTSFKFPSIVKPSAPIAALAPAVEAGIVHNTISEVITVEIIDDEVSADNAVGVNDRCIDASMSADSAASPAQDKAPSMQQQSTSTVTPMAAAVQTPGVAASHTTEINETSPNNVVDFAVVSTPASATAVKRAIGDITVAIATPAVFKKTTVGGAAVASKKSKKGKSEAHAPSTVRSITSFFTKQPIAVTMAVTAALATAEDPAVVIGGDVDNLI